MVSGTFRSLVCGALRLATAALVCLLAVGHSSIALAQRSVSPLKRLSLEELMEIDVTSVSRRPERIATAAAAIQVITAEDLRPRLRSRSMSS